MPTNCEIIRAKACEHAGCPEDCNTPDAAAPDVPGAKTFNLSGLGTTAKNALAKVDAVLDQYGPIINTFTPTNLQVVEALAIKLIDQANELVNPAPAPAPAPASST